MFSRLTLNSRHAIDGPSSTKQTHTFEWSQFFIYQPGHKISGGDLETNLRKLTGNGISMDGDIKIKLRYFLLIR